MSSITAPMKGEAAPDDLSLLRYPLMATPKLDGIRAMKINDEIKTARFKPLPNLYTRKMLLAILPDGSDGELFRRGATEMGQQTSAFMTITGEPDFLYYMFDFDFDGNLEREYRHRMKRMRKYWEENMGGYDDFIPNHVIPLYPKIIYTPEELQAFVDECLAAGYEGVIVRDPYGPYKCGRSTVKQGYLLKIKPFEDGEAIIIGFEEQLENTNVATLDAFGHTTRSSHKANKLPKDTLGKFVVQRLSDKLEFRVGTGRGLTNALRKTIWENQRKYMGKIITYKHQKIGAKTAPRIAIFKGFRDVRDMTRY